MLVPTGPTDHLFIVCNDTCAMGANLVVNISSVRDLCDTTCILDVGDHPFVQHPSFVYYAMAKITYAANIQRGFEAGALRPQPDLAEEVFGRVEAGMLRSPDTPANVVRYFTRL
ncbi:MAG: hypothetical protein ACI8TF_002471 [Paracoccaceae bacterium]|jgi:hypothetical protein